MLLLLPATTQAATENAVTITDGGTYHLVTIDLTKNVTRKEVGKQYAEAILEALPDYEALMDSYLAEIVVGSGFTLETCLSRVDKIKGNVPEDYVNELKGMMEVFSYETDLLGDGRLSKNELWVLNLMGDVIRPTACAAASVFGSASSTGNNILGRSLDWTLGSENQGAAFHMVEVVKNGDKSVCLIGFLGLQCCISGFNDDHVFAAVLDSDTGEEYTAKNKRSYPFDLRYALENKTSLSGVADYMRDKAYAFNHLIFLADSTESKVLENEISQSKRQLRSWDSELRSPTTWGITDAIATVNSFLLPDNFDNQTEWPSNTERWASLKTQTSKRLPQISFEGMKEIITYYNGSTPGTSSEGDIYHVNEDAQTLQSIVFEPDSYHLQVAFAPAGDLPATPVFKTIFDGLSDPFSTSDAALNLLWYNQNNGTMIRWKLLDTAQIADTSENSGWANSGGSMTLAGSWYVGGILDTSDNKCVLWHNPDNGKVAYWKMTGDALLQDTDKDSGWGFVTDNLSYDSTWTFCDTFFIDDNPFIFWHNQSDKKVYFWKLDSDFKLAGNTEGTDWGLVSDSVTLDGSWSVAGHFTNSTGNYLIWNDSSTGKASWWKLDDDGKLVDTQQNSGWGYVSENMPDSAEWSISDVTTINGTPYVIWSSQASGLVVYWKLTSRALLENETKGSGWDLVYETPLSDTMYLAGNGAIDDLPVLFWRNTNTNMVLYWKLNKSCKLSNETQNDGWGAVSNLSVVQDWSLSGTLQPD